LSEKKSIQGLNDQLASYIDLVRSRDERILALESERTTVEETHLSEITQVKTLYGQEMVQLRKALDQVSVEKMQFQIEAQKASREAEEAKIELATKEKLLSATDKELRSLQAKYNDALNRANTAEGELKNIKPENATLKKKLADAKANLEDETVKRVDLQNKLLSLEETSKFERQVVEQQLNESRIKKQLDQTDAEERISEKYERQYEESVAKIRESYERELANHRKDFARTYDDKIAQLKAALDEEKQNGAGNHQQLIDLQSRVTTICSRNSELEAVNANLQKRIADLIKDLEEKSSDFRAILARKEAEIRSKDEAIDENVKQYQEILETKLELDAEIGVYRNLLEGERTRLGLDNFGSPKVGTSFGRPPLKRRRIEEEETTQIVSTHSGSGKILIEQTGSGDKAIKLVNREETPLNIAGWTLTNSSGGTDFSYKFPRGAVIGPNETCCVWSSDSNQEHNPPHNYVMKKGGWAIGDESATTLVNKDGEEEARRENKEERRLTGTVSAYGAGASPAGRDKNCVLM